MTANPLAIGLLQPADAERAVQPDWLRTRWDDTLGAGYNIILLPVIRDLPAADQVFDLDSYDTLPVNAFTRKAHRGLSSQE
jgi:hypothetical protein